MIDQHGGAVICCGQRIRTISIDGTRLVFTYCGRCEATRWSADGRPVNPASALGLLAPAPAF